eukprot:Gregarina_sp_Pseudo_9__1429@NODE_1957_length_1233_cov_62_468174_g1814_i0_p1_GENE_NODE_1957_length_1233_cov_62_468174_g1814_i0NODE_1957_length_1233_cov_62_468174_g1814_i0_p1_ORF_typecomplete_len345_score65_94Lin8/PF03353_15/0_17Herpes_gE/PF02480_16/7_4e02Herpes_gE/PF02480_16/0_59CENPB_dimeris/PF09026_10/0_24CENPB_dimeris/PF09026_10/4_8e03_NODE_1957_length_1233_cov_62_468174_g1814_i01071141
MLLCRAVLYLVACFAAATAEDDAFASGLIPIVQNPFRVTQDSKAERRDLEGDEPNGAGAELVESGKTGLGGQNQEFDHVGQKFVRKALEVLDQRLAEAAKHKNGQPEDGEQVEDEEEEDDDDEEEGGAPVEAEEEVESGKLGHKKSAKFSKVKSPLDEEVEAEEEAFQLPQKKRKPSLNNPDVDLAGADPELKVNEANSRRKKAAAGLDSDDDNEALIEFPNNNQVVETPGSVPTQQLIPVELDVNEGLENAGGDQPPAEGNEMYSGKSQGLEAHGIPGFRMVGSAAAGVGVVGSAAYCCLARRRTKKQHSRSELPMYEPGAGASNSPTPDGYRVGRRGFTKYR